MNTTVSCPVFCVVTAIEILSFIRLVSWTMESRICEIGAVHNTEIGAVHNSEVSHIRYFCYGSNNVLTVEVII